MKETIIVKSLKGHDTGRVYIVVGNDGDDFVFVTDGKYRKLDNPKRKRRKHLFEISKTVLPDGATDAEVRRICKI